MPTGHHKPERICLHCSSVALVGLKVCKRHGGNLPVNQRISQVAKLNAYLRPISELDPEADPIRAFDVEHRRTLARIRYLDEVLERILEGDNEFADPSGGLFYGLEKEESITASEWPGKNTTKSARVNVVYELQMKERAHLVKLHSLYIGAGIAKRALEIEAEKVRALDTVITGVLRALGHDVRDPGVRKAVRENLMALPGAGSVSPANAPETRLGTTPGVPASRPKPRVRAVPLVIEHVEHDLESEPQESTITHTPGAPEPLDEDDDF